jgi:hypothetical protein
MNIDAAKLTQVYNTRPDLQAVYNSDGTKKNKNDGNPLTLQDWAKQFGIKEEPSLMPVVSPELQAIFAKRPDLQAIYNPDGSRKNPSDGNPTTLQDWAEKFGTTEEISLDPAYASLHQYFTDDEIKNMPPDIKTGLAAFADVQQKNYESGKAIEDINAQNWNDAMTEAAKDPAIVAKYGDSLKVAIDNTNSQLADLAAGYTEEQAATARQQKLDTQNLQASEADAGRAYSGFRKQAQERLAADQSDVITSSKRQLANNLKAVTQPFEQKYGSAALGQITNPNIDNMTYKPLGLTGTDQFAKENDIRNRATELATTTQSPTQ